MDLYVVSDAQDVTDAVDERNDMKEQETETVGDMVQEDVDLEREQDEIVIDIPVGIDDDRNHEDEDDEDEEGSGRSRSRGRASYTLYHKTRVLEVLAENGGNVSLTSKMMSVSRKNIQRWRKQSQELEEFRKDRRVNTRKARRKPYQSEGKFPTVERKVVEWVREERVRENAVTMATIRKKAVEVAGEGTGEFKASEGWAKRFMKRNDLVVRATTSTGQMVPSDAQEQALRFLRHIEYTITTQQLSNSQVANMDETPIYFDLPRNTTVDFKGLRTIRVRTTGNEKLRFTVVLTALASGHKMMPMVIFKGLKNVPKEKFPSGVHIAVASGGSMTTQLMLDEYLPHVWRSRPSSVFKLPYLFVMDQHLSHKDINVTSALRTEHNTTANYIPAGMTCLLQPMDVCLNRPFKALMQKKWEEWMAEGEIVLTKGGKRKRASYALVATWVKEAWGEISRDMVVKSFASCGLSKTPQLHERLANLVDQGVLPADDAIVEISSESDGEDEEEDFC